MSVSMNGNEWHPFVVRLLQVVAPKGEVGITYVYRFAADAVSHWNQLWKRNSSSMMKSMRAAQLYESAGCEAEKERRI